MSTERCVVCGWWLGGTSTDPEQPPRPACKGGSSNPRCAFNWLSVDPEDLDTYDEYLIGVLPQ